MKYLKKQLTSPFCQTLEVLLQITNTCSSQVTCTHFKHKTPFKVPFKHLVGNFGLTQRIWKVSRHIFNFLMVPFGWLSCFTPTQLNSFRQLSYLKMAYGLQLDH